MTRYITAVSGWYLSGLLNIMEQLSLRVVCLLHETELSSQVT